MPKTHFKIEFLMHDFDHIDNCNFITCWEINDDYDCLEDAIKVGYDYIKKHNYYSFIIVKDNVSQFYFDSKVYDETGKYKADDQ